MTAEDIEDEIARTRGEMADTLTAIERKLSPQQIMDQAVDTMRDLLSDRSRVAEIVRDNPIPLALVGLGLGWLAISAATGRRPAAGTRMGSYESMEGVAPGWRGDDTGYAPGVESPAYGAVAGAIESGAESAAAAAAQARGRVTDWGRQARASANQAADRTRDAFQDHPLTMGAVAMMVGAAVGILLPRSRAEERALGEMGGDLARQAREAGGELAHKAGRVAERAMQGAREEGSKEVDRSFGRESGSPSGLPH